jgi:conjugal transfer/entry exclusion protein
MADTWRAASGNSTTEQQRNDLIDAGNPVADFAATAATQGTREAILNAVMKWGRTLGGLTEDRANKIADILLSRSAPEELKRAIARQELTTAQKNQMMRLIGPASQFAVSNGPTGPQ